MRALERIAVAASVLLAACALTGLGPRVESDVPFDTALINKQVLDAVALAVKDVDTLSWSKDVTYLDVLEGTLETGYFRKPDIAAMQLRAQINREGKVVKLTVKGVGPYYSRLPIEEGLSRVRAALVQRLNDVRERCPSGPKRC